MAPRKKHKCSVVLFDVASRDDFKEEALKCYVNICGDKYFSGSDDCSQLILMNTSETSNKFNEKDESTYLNIVEATEMVCPINPLNARYIEEAESAPGNWIEGLDVAVEALCSHFDSNRFDTFQLIILSDLSTPLNVEKKNIDRTIKNIKKQLCQIDAYIYFLGFDIPITKMLTSKKEIHNWVKNINIEDQDNIKIAYSILEECMGVICNFHIGKELVKSFLPSNRGYPFTEPLAFQDLEIITACYKFIVCESLPKPRRDKDGMLEVTYVYAEDQSHEVERDTTIKGLAIYDKLVIIPADVSKGIKEYTRFFKLLGFTDASNVPNDYMLASNTNVINVYETKDSSIGGLNYIIKACHKFGNYGIALRAYMRNSRPKLYCLIPKLEPLHFLAVELPYCEDVDQLYKTGNCKTIKSKESYPDYEDVSELKDDLYGYLDTINSKDKVKIHPCLTGNFSKQRIFSNLLRKLKGEEIEAEELPLGDFRIDVDEDVYNQINSKWLSRNETQESNGAP